MAFRRAGALFALLALAALVGLGMVRQDVGLDWDLDLEIPLPAGGTVRGRVVDEDGRAVAGLKLGLVFGIAPSPSSECAASRAANREANTARGLTEFRSVLEDPGPATPGPAEQ